MLQHTASPASVCLPIILTAVTLWVADLVILVSGAFGRGIFSRLKRIWIRTALFVFLIFLLPLVYFVALFAGCALV
jgi:hypothetical protein